MRMKTQKMKRLLSFVMAFVMMLSLLPTVAFAADSSATLYLKPNGNWTQAGARFAAYFFGNGETWVGMTDANGDGIYEVEAPAGYPSVIFCRMSPSTSANNWNNKWNQTADLTIPTDGKNMYTVKDGTWDKGAGTWSTYTYVAPTYTVAGTISPAGWSPENGDKLTDEDNDGIFTYTYTNVAAGDYLFKVTNGTWNASWGGDADTDGNYGVSVAVDGSSVTVTFNAVTKTVSATVAEPAVYHQVTFVTGEGSAVAPQSVKDGQLLEQPADPTWEGYAFAGWYTDAECTAAYDFTAAVSGELTLYAKWDEAPAETDPEETDPEETDPEETDPEETDPEETNPEETYPEIDETVTVYFRNDWYWPEVYVYYWDAFSDNTWPGEKMTFVETLAQGDVYSAKIPAWATGIIFSGQENQNPDNWQETPTVTGFTEGSAYYIHWDGENKCSPFTYPDEGGEDPSQPATYIVAGTEALCGTAWDVANTDNTMTLGEDGLYTITFESVYPGTHSFKVTDGTWDNCWGGEGEGGNYEITLDAISHVTVTFDAATKAISVTTEATGETVTEVTYEVTFHFADTLGWGGVSLYTWTTAGLTPTGGWPGSAMSLATDGFYSMKFTYQAPVNQGLNFIFSCGGTQTADLSLAASEFVNNKAEKWVVLDAKNTEGKYTAKVYNTGEAIAVSPVVTDTTVRFAYLATDAEAVYVAGTFNDWSTTATPMTKNAYGIWQATVENVAPGIHQYKFYADGQWVLDPANSWVAESESGQNSAFLISDASQDTNRVTIRVHYTRTDKNYTNWNAYVWTDTWSKQYDFTVNDNVADTVIEVDGRATQSVSFKVRKSVGTNKWAAEEAEVRVNLANIVSGTIDVYTGGGSTNQVLGGDVVYDNKITSVQLNYDNNTVTVQTYQQAANPATAFSIVNTQDADDDIAITLDEDASSGSSYVFQVSETLDLVTLYRYKIVFGEQKNENFHAVQYDIGISNVYASDKFAEEFTYTDIDRELGATWTSQSTTFKVWAPTAEAVSVNLYTSGTKGTDDLEKTVAMTRGEKGIWSVTVEGNLHGKYYTYAVKVDGKNVEAVDPYARTTGVNGDRGMVINLDSTDPKDGWTELANKPASYMDAVIYELHVRDFSIDDSSGMVNKGKFLALTETGTTTANGTATGLDYLKDLGITHLHLLPIYDYASVDESALDEPQFNWGYDPQNYNVPEGSYSTDPYNGAIRVAEMKEMVDTLHENGIGVIMDVVYNHVYDANTFCYNNIVPSYFSRVNSNRSGCGNDTASEREMVRKYIVESVLYWAEEYHLDGFRFDLVGLIDVQTINQIVTEVHKVRPDIIFYGEGWDMDGTNREPGTEMAKQGNASKTPGFSYFSDSMRNNLGGNNGHSTGFASGANNGATSTIAADWMAKPWWTSNPNQVVQYASCHDNYTLVDKIILSTGKSKLDSTVIRMNNLAAAFYMTAQGIPFIHAGEELLREKLQENGGRCENSYNASDFVNHIEWSNLEKDEYAAVSAYYKGLIAFRKAHPALRYDTAALIQKNVKNRLTTAGALAFQIDGNAAGDDDLYVIFNSSASSQTFSLPEGTWTIRVNGEKAGTASLGTASGSVTVSGISAMVLTKEDEGEDVEVVQDVTLYFSNNKFWSEVYAYAWTGDTYDLGAWPGTKMTFVEKNSYGEDIYSITVTNAADGIIFHDGGSNQTADQTIGTDNTGYYCTEKDTEGKFGCGTYMYVPSNVGDAGDYFLVGYINGADYEGGNYAFDENGQLKATFTADSYVYVVNGTKTETYMTDGYQGAVTSAVLKNIGKHTLTGAKWDKLLIPGGTEVTVTMVKNSDNTVTLSYQSNVENVEDTSGIQSGVTLHCWNWSFAEIEENMAAIAELGYTAIQTSPIQPLKEATNLESKTVGTHWWVYYQPVDFVITTDSGNALGTKAELESMIQVAHSYGIQVIVDVVLNHLGNETGNDLSPEIPEYLRDEDYWHDINTDITDWNDRYDMTQNCLSGLPDLNTANDEIQGYALDFLKECIDIGVDGFRFDMAKSIETPIDDASFASDFWPTVIGGAESYAAAKGKDVYMYGEVLDNPAIAVSAYTQYMAVTDNSWGNNLRSQVAGGSASVSAGYHKAADASVLVIWAESHDTYATDDKNQSSAAVSEQNINKTWALVAARADAMGLYFARPETNDQAIGVASSTGWDNPEVGAVNKFNNAFLGTSETLGNSGSFAYVVRGDAGIVLVNVSGTSAEVAELQVSMADGTYREQITGNTFTVANGKLSGTIGTTGIAVVYNAEEEVEKFEFYGTNLNLGNNLNLKFAFLNSHVEDWTGYYAEMVRTYGDGKEDHVLRVNSEDWLRDGSYYVVTYPGFAAKEMCDEVTVTVYDPDGNAVSEPKTDSIQAYAKRIFDKKSSARTVIVDMLNYGAAAQEKFGYCDTLELANDVLSPEDQQYASTLGTLQNSQVMDPEKAYASNVTLKSNIDFQMAFRGVTEGMYAVVTYTGYKDNEETETFRYEDLEVNGRYHVVRIKSMVVADARCMVTVTVFNADGTVYTVYEDSMESYVKRQVGDDVTSEEAKVFVAFMIFADSARAYLDK